ncbi:MAG: ATP-binding cassette domain-containing protein [Sphingobacteriales bacterium]|nr:MAG: ATP-binding cassette domain-containing protein [Sphingobacteriales bacterium]
MQASLIRAESIFLDYQVRCLKNSGRFINFFKPALYQSNAVLKGIDFEVSGPGVTSIIGRNGSGKTSLIKILTGILTPTSGTVRVLGEKPQARKKAALLRTAVIFGHRRSLAGDLSLYENLKLTAALYGVSKQLFLERFEELCELLRLSHLLHRPVKGFSLGESMKAEIAAALLYQPTVIFLDEPTVGLDLEAQIRIREAIETYAIKFQSHFILTSHNLKDIVYLTKNYQLLKDGVLTKFEPGSMSSGAIESHLERFLLT